jgi:hypothetical protein
MRVGAIRCPWCLRCGVYYRLSLLPQFSNYFSHIIQTPGIWRIVNLLLVASGPLLLWHFTVYGGQLVAEGLDLLFQHVVFSGFSKFEFTEFLSLMRTSGLDCDGPSTQWKTTRYQKGLFSLQIHVGESGKVFFRNITVKEASPRTRRSLSSTRDTARRCPRIRP